MGNIARLILLDVRVCIELFISHLPFFRLLLFSPTFDVDVDIDMDIDTNRVCTVVYSQRGCGMLARCGVLTAEDK
jgi:hypothetical protein